MFAAPKSSNLKFFNFSSKDKPASPVTQKPVDFFGREERDSSKFDSAGKQPLNRSETEQIRAETYRKSLNLTVDPAAIAAVEERYKHTLGKVDEKFKIWNFNKFWSKFDQKTVLKRQNRWNWVKNRWK